ncbi:MAG TPA: hypothetical protein VGP99_10445 [Tepidisphaeraceae bacterium]|jgi:hypothetical protein|nr:hypothetical protein [Tepidisphaeraceae bacterium]
MHILDQDSPGLATKIEALPLSQRRNLVAVGLRVAMQPFGNLEPSISSLVQTAIENKALSEAQVAEARLLEEWADDKYFSLRADGVAEAIWLEWYYKSRLVAGVVSGFGGTSWSETADALYELCLTRDDPSDILEAVWSVVESAGAPSG